MTVGEMLSRMSSQEFTDWLAFSTIEPFGSQVDDLRAGTIASMIANTNRDAKRTPVPWKPLDFMPWSDVPAAANDDQQPAVPINADEARSNMILALCFPKAIRNG